MIPLSVPNFTGNELNYVTEAIKTEWVSTNGKFVDQFENNIARYVGTKYASACQNGTSGLHTALMVCGVNKDQSVIVPTLTFIAAVNPVRYIGAEPIFMDCDHSLCMDPLKLQEFCIEECTFIHGDLLHIKTNRIIKCLIIVHVFGNMADMESIMEIAEEYNLKVIEDATEALGTYYTNGKYAGRYAGTIGDIGVYSFNGNKIITTGGGGMIVSDHKQLIDKAKYLTTQAKNDALYYVHDEIGYNYRMTNLQAALGLAQLEQLESFIEKKTSNYMLYVKKIAEITGLEILRIRSGIRGNHWFYALFCSEKYGKKRDEIISFLNNHDIQVRPIWGLIHKQKPYINFTAYKIKKAEFYWNHIINIPCSPQISLDEINTVVQFLLAINNESLSNVSK